MTAEWPAVDDDAVVDAFCAELAPLHMVFAVQGNARELTDARQRRANADIARRVQDAARKAWTSAYQAVIQRRKENTMSRHDTDIEIYESSFTTEPKSGDCVTSIVMASDAHAPAVGDTIALAFGGKGPQNFRVTARTHLVSDAGHTDGKASWLKMWIFVERI